MQITVTLNGGESPAEVGTLARMLAAAYGTVWRQALAADAAQPEEAAPPPLPAPGAIFTAVAEAPASAPAVPSDTSSASAPPVPVPPSAPVAVAPSVPAAPPSPAGVEFDAAGLPWDGRINASTKTKTQKGVWTLKRGVEDATVLRVQEELRAALGIAAPPPVPPVPPAPPAAEGAPPAPAAPPAPVSEFVRFMKKMSGLRTGEFPRLTAEEQQTALASAGLASFMPLSSRPDLIPAVEAYVDAILASKMQ